MKKDRKYVPPTLELSVVAVESGFADSITDTSTIQEHGRDTDDTTSPEIDFYF